MVEFQVSVIHRQAAVPTARVTRLTFFSAVNRCLILYNDKIEFQYRSLVVSWPIHSLDSLDQGFQDG